MKILSLDTSTPHGSVAISEDEKIIVCLDSDVTTKHSSKLLPLIDKALSASKVNIDEIDLFITTIGPGSFTGLRIGLSCIKGLAFKDKKPVVALSTLQAMANSINGFSKVASIYDALRENVFYSIFDTSGAFPVRLEEDKLIEKNRFLETITTDFLVIGNGIEVVQKELDERNIPHRVDIQRPVAKDFVSLGLHFFRNNEYVRDVFSLEPAYLQEFEVKGKERGSNE